jgi:hypothetical protein
LHDAHHAPDPGLFSGPFVAGADGRALVAAGDAGTALVAAGVSAGFGCFSQPPITETKAVKLRRLTFLMAANY